MAGAAATVVVPTTGRLATSGEVLERLLRDPACGELLVVLEGEQPETRQRLEALAAAEPRLRWIQNSRTGAGGMFARHAGAEAASQSIVVFIDDDVMAGPGLISGHVEHHEQAAGLVVLGYMPVRARNLGRRPDYPVRLYAASYEAHCRAYERDPTEVLRRFWAGNHSLRRADVLRAGPPHPSFAPVYHSDRDFGLRLAALGLTPRFDRALRAEHAYRCPPAKFVRDSRRSGAGTLLVHAQHQTIAGPLSITAYERLMPPRSRRLIAACRRRPALALAAGPALRAAAAGSAWLGRRELELRFGHVLRCLEQQRGMLAARAGSRL